MKIGILVLSLVLAFGIGQAQDLTLVSWNILNFPGSTGTEREDDFQLVLQNAGPDILVVQEMIGQAGVNQFLNNILDEIEPGAWNAGPYHDSYDTDRALFYRDGTVEVLDYGWIDTALRDIEWWLLRPVGSSDEFRIYTCHLKASSGSDNEQKRLLETQHLRNDLDTLDADLPFILCGDLNIYYGDEPAYQELIGSGPGQLHDPINQTGYWHNNASYASIHTQSTRTASFGGGATGGMDDRFDQILVSEEMLDATGIDVLPATYLAYGNDGAHFNQSIIEGGNSAVPYAVAEAIHNSSDHLPIIVQIHVDDATAVAEGAPASLRLEARPNPFNPTTTLTFTLAQEGPITLSLYDPAGRLLTTLASGHHSAGAIERRWDGKDDSGRPLPSGVYFALLDTEGERLSRKIVLIR